MNNANWWLTRRQFVTGAGAATLLPAFPSAHSATNEPAPAVPELHGPEFNLTIAEQVVSITGRQRRAATVNGSLPGPILRAKEGDTVTIHVTNNLQEDTSIHWHGIILPANMDGVPGISFDGIKPGETFTYRFTLRQSGTYWYHGHSGFQEPLGLYGALIIEPETRVTHQFDREHTLVLSDWSDEDPGHILANLKKMSHYYNTRERTLFDWFRDVEDKGFTETLSEREMWNNMRMMDTDIADVTGRTYTYLMNGVTPANNWLGLFEPGEKIRLRVINASSMSIFDVRIPGLPLTVVSADGQEVQPVTVDEFRIGTAETYDIIVEPPVGAYTVFAQSIDRSGYARGTLTSDPNRQAIIPPMDHRPVLTHADMGMAHDNGQMNHGQMNHGEASVTAMPRGEIDHGMHGAQGHDGHSSTLSPAGTGSNANIEHVDTEFGPQVDMRSAMPMSGLRDPGIGLRNHQHRYGRRVLNYGDLRGMHPTRDRRQPSREIQLHLTGNMNRYMWSMNGVKFADAEPLQLTYGERVRIVLVNDTMMTHPIHLHGLWSELETGDAEYIPRKHTVLVQPGAKISYLVTVDAEGSWAYHCHLLYHMAGMFRRVDVIKEAMQPGGHHEHH